MMLYFRFTCASLVRLMLAYGGTNRASSTHLETSKLVPDKDLMQLNSNKDSFSSMQENGAAVTPRLLDGF